MRFLVSLVKGFATALFAATWIAQRQGYLDGTVTTPGLILGIGAFALLTLGGALAYVYGVRVIKRDVPIADALIPGRLENNRTRTGASGARTDWTGWSVRNRAPSDDLAVIVTNPAERT